MSSLKFGVPFYSHGPMSPSHLTSNSCFHLSDSGAEFDPVPGMEACSLLRQLINVNNYGVTSVAQGKGDPLVSASCLKSQATRPPLGRGVRPVFAKSETMFLQAIVCFHDANLNGRRSDELLLLFLSRSYLYLLHLSRSRNTACLSCGGNALYVAIRS